MFFIAQWTIWPGAYLQDNYKVIYSDSVCR